MADIRLLGLHISVYTRIARLALEEKAIDYQFDEVDIFADAGPPADSLALNPFGTIPCLLNAMNSRSSVRASPFHADES